jgi:hypothetical protein
MYVAFGQMVKMKQNRVSLAPSSSQHSIFTNYFVLGRLAWPLHKDDTRYQRGAPVFLSYLRYCSLLFPALGKLPRRNTYVVRNHLFDLCIFAMVMAF